MVSICDSCQVLITASQKKRIKATVPDRKIHGLVRCNHAYPYMVYVDHSDISDAPLKTGE